MCHQLPLDLYAATVYWMQPQFKAQRGQACVPTHPYTPQRQISEIMVPGHTVLLRTFLWLQKQFCCCISKQVPQASLEPLGTVAIPRGRRVATHKLQSFVVGCHCPTIIWDTRSCQEVIYAVSGIRETGLQLPASWSWPNLLQPSEFILLFLPSGYGWNGSDFSEDSLSDFLLSNKMSSFSKCPTSHDACLRRR